jgi:hypothetical protein
MQQWKIDPSTNRSNHRGAEGLVQASDLNYKNREF